MDELRFVLGEALKILSLAFLGLLAAKAVTGLAPREKGLAARRLTWVRGMLYGAVLVLTILGARNVGYDLAAAFYCWTSQDNLARSQLGKAYDNATRAAQLRPGVLRYWRQVEMSKLTLRQFASVLEDQRIFESLSGGSVDEEDVYRFVLCHFLLGDYDQVISSAQQLIQQNRYYAAPYVLLGWSYTAQRKYAVAEKVFLEVLQLYPSHQAAVEGLAHTYFLMGNRAGAVGVLGATAKFPFPPQARKRFDDLKALYAQ